MSVVTPPIMKWAASAATGMRSRERSRPYDARNLEIEGKRVTSRSRGRAVASR